MVTRMVGDLQIEVVRRFHELKLFYVVFVMIMTYHAFNGLKMIAIEYGLRLGNLFYVLLIFAMVY